MSRREIYETSGANLAHPEVELPVAVGEERDEPPIGRNFGAAFRALPIREARELSVGQRDSRRRRRRAGSASSQRPSPGSARRLRRPAP